MMNVMLSLLMIGALSKLLTSKENLMICTISALVLNDLWILNPTLLHHLNRTIEICNGDQKTLEYVSTGFGSQRALIATKNPYGLDIKLPYFWFDAGHGERCAFPF